jgi:4-amino-4-deoxy-L-arabinose transferase-like glycosyltransferase
MASDKRFVFSVPVGFVACLLGAIGILALMGSFAPNDDAAPEISATDLGRPLMEVVLSAALFTFVIKSAVSGIIPKQVIVCAIVVPPLFLWLTVSLFRLGKKLGGFGPDAEGRDPPWYRRHGFWLIALMALIYLPLLGSWSLIDPWETHYGEVAREMLARDDWISLWWAQDGWFWSKPILDFWIQGLAFSLFGVRYWPDQMIAGVAEGRWPQPEWAARLPIFVMTVLGMYVLYRGVAKVFGRRAAFLGSVILATTPYWFLIGRQTMTDMPYVAGVIATIGFFLLAISSPDELPLRSVVLRLGKIRARISALHLVFVAVLLVALPQILYLGSRNLSLHLDVKAEQGREEPVALTLGSVLSGQVKVRGFRPHKDEISEGSGGGNCGLPGNSQCKKASLVNPKVQPALMALGYAALAGWLIWSNRRETRQSRVFYLAAWLGLAIAGMAKGAPGLVLPLFVLGAYVALTNKWDELVRADLGAMLLIFCISCLPWFLQMYLRHGDAFVNRLLLHDMYQRAFQHVHDTNQGEDVSFRYYIWQLGYGLFPWNGLLAAAFVWWFRRERDTSDPVHQGALVLFIWALGAFGMFTITLTKFHHYILPMVPAIAMLGGLLLSEALDTRDEKSFDWRSAALYIVGVLLGIALLWLGIARCFPGSISGFVSGELLPRRPWLGAGLMTLGLLLLIGAVMAFGRRSFSSSPEQRALSEASLGAVGIVGAVAVALAGRDFVVAKNGDVAGSARLIHLFTYQYQRPWPESLDFSAPFIGFTLLMVAVCLFWMVRRLRSHAVVAASALAVVFAGWGANVYMVRCAPHWGQRETIMAYYRARSGPDEPLVAFQMNWKGENFYTGNRVPAFVSTGKKFKTWLDEQKKKGVKVMFFTTEHTRISTLKRELSNPKSFEVLTNEELNNKFFLARVELD